MTEIQTQDSIIIRRNYLLIRRCIELISIVILSPILLTLFLLISVIVLIDMKKDIIYKQVRAGKNGKPFTMYKFRTMKELPRCRNNYFCHQKDRVTKFGYFLRVHRLDELPQAWNVMKGEMSFIGPRPEMIESYFYYLGSIQDYSKRTLIEQGVTGWAQVNYNHTMTMEGNKIKLNYDIYYINNVSFKLDCIILLKTLKTVITGKNSE